MKTKAPCGNWPSPITAEMVAGKTPRLAEPCVQTTDKNTHRLFWLESQPAEKGRFTVMMQEDGKISSILPNPLNCRSKVHEYGGGSYCVAGDDLYFVLADDQRIYHCQFTATDFIPKALTPDDGRRYGDLVLDTARNRLIAVCENHDTHMAEPENSLVAIALDTSGENLVKAVTPLVSGDDFYAYPRISPDGNSLCWISWNHPNMPWDASGLYLATFTNNGTLTGRKVIVPEKNDSIFQPSWSPDGKLFFVSDRNNWWNLYCVNTSEAKTNENTPLTITPVTQLESECATPLWVLGMSCYGFIGPNTIIAATTQKGLWQLHEITVNPNNKHTTVSPLQTDIDSISAINTNPNIAVFIGANATMPPQIFQLNTKITPVTNITLPIATGHLSNPLAIEFPTANHKTAYAFYYPPTHEAYIPDTPPPMIFICHGGPTAAADTALNPKIQYWTNRGFAVMDVNYRGSTGYGRNFRQSLHNSWGITDVEDMCAAADYAIQQGWATADKLIIKGSSAGGYTVLASLCFSQHFNAGVSLYGIGDLEALVRDTHKFEARYLDKLVGEYHKEQSRYKERSPIYAVHKITCPILVFQGLEDKVVPPSQAQQMVDAVADKGLPVAYVTFADEGHGFRNPNNIKTMLNAEHSFYCQVLNLPHPNDLPRLPIKNIEA